MDWKLHDNKPPLSFDEEEFFEPGEANANGHSVSNSLQFANVRVETGGDIDSSNKLIEREEATANGHFALDYSQLKNYLYDGEIWEPTPTNETLQELEASKSKKYYNSSISVDSEQDNPSLEIDEPRGETESGNFAILSLQLATNTSEDDDWLEPSGTSEDDDWEPPVISDNEEEDLVEPPATSDNEEEDLVELPKTSDNEEEDLGELPKTSEDDDWWEPSASSFFKRISKPAGFFQDDNGKNSPLRVGSFAVLIAAILFGWLTIGGKATAAEAELTYGLLAAAFGTKTVNKFSTSRV